MKTKIRPLAVLMFVGIVSCDVPSTDTNSPEPQPRATLSSQTTSPPVKGTKAGAESVQTPLQPHQVERIAPAIVHERVTSGEALLVCAYDSDIGFWAFELEGAISHQEFKDRLDQLPRDQEVFFYCS